MSIDNVQDLEKIEKLRRLKFIGDFPKGVEVLLVPLDTALNELLLVYKDLTIGTLRSILNRRNVQILPTVADWMKFQGKEENKKKQPRV